MNENKTLEEIVSSLNIIDDTLFQKMAEEYINTKIDDGSDIAELMRIYKEQGAFDFHKFPNTSNRKLQFIGKEGGKQEMCEAVENYAKEYAKEYAKNHVKEKSLEVAKKLFQEGADFEMVLRCIEDISEEELREVYESVVGKN